jgi:TolB protein
VEAGEPLAEVPSSLEQPLPKRPLWPWLVGLGIVLAGGALFAWRMLTRPDPLRVLVAVEYDGQWWQGSKPAALLADELAERFAKMGFDPVRAGDPAVLEQLEDAGSPREAAKKLRAAFLVTGKIDAKVVELPIPEGFFEVQVDAPLRLEHVEESKPIAEGVLHTFSGAKDKDKAVKWAAESAARLAFDLALPAMLEHPDVAEIVKGNDPKLVDQLAPARNFAEGRKKAMDEAAADYADVERDRLKDDKSPTKPTFISAADAQDRLCAVGPSGLLVASAPVAPFYSPDTLELLRHTGLEEVAWREGATTRELWRGYQAFDYPTAAAAGQPVALVENLYGWARSIVVIDAGGAHRIRVEPEKRYSEPEVAPDGTRLALAERACADCPRQIVVLELAEGKELMRLGDADALELGDFAWLDPSHLLVVLQPLPPPPGEGDELAAPPSIELWSIDVGGGERASLFATDGGTLVDPIAAPDGSRVAVGSPLDDAIVTYDTAKKELTSRTVGGRAASLAFSPDGKRVAFELRSKGPEDIAVLEVASGAVTRLTDNRWPDRYPLFSSDGRTIYFEARSIDPVFPGRREISRIASLPAP